MLGEHLFEDLENESELTWANELGIVVEDSSVEMMTDSSGAKSFASRRGSGRIRHIEVKWQWLQQAVADGRFRMSKVEGR